MDATRTGSRITLAKVWAIPALMFAGTIAGQLFAGWHVAMQDAARHGQPLLSLGAFMASPEFLSSVFENWESEFLQMSAYVLLTAVLVQHGSAESNDPDEPPRDQDLDEQASKANAPGIRQWGTIWRALYARSLGIALGLHFIISFVIHWTQIAKVARKRRSRTVKSR